MLEISRHCDVLKLSVHQRALAQLKNVTILKLVTSLVNSFRLLKSVAHTLSKAHLRFELQG